MGLKRDRTTAADFRGYEAQFTHGQGIRTRRQAQAFYLIDRGQHVKDDQLFVHR
jgi:hypothetical protein